MEDPFIYGPDGIPVSVKPAQRSQLSRAELHDLIVATSAHNQAEALALVEWLRDARIPALHRATGSTPFGHTAAVDILVPRKLVREATDCIALFRHESKEEKKRRLEPLGLTRDAMAKRDPERPALLIPSAERRPVRRAQAVATLPPAEKVPLEEWADFPIEEPPRKPTAFQLAQRGAGAALLAIGGSLLALELMMNGLKTPLSIVALCLTLLGLSLTLRSLPR